MALHIIPFSFIFLLFFIVTGKKKLSLNKLNPQSTLVIMT